MDHHFARTSLGVQSVQKNVLIEFRVLSSIPKLESSVLVDLSQPEWGHHFAWTHGGDAKAMRTVKNQRR